MDDNAEEGYKFTAIHINPPFYDFELAEKKLGVDFETFSEDGFKEFLEDKFIKTISDLRKNYAKRDLKFIKDIAHGIKGAFVYINSPIVHESANLLMAAALNKDHDKLEDLYVDLLVKMNLFLDKLIDFYNPISGLFLKRYIKLTDEFNSKESEQMIRKMKNKIEEIQSLYMNKIESKSKKGASYQNTVIDEIQIEETQKKTCCKISDCSIY